MNYDLIEQTFNVNVRFVESGLCTPAMECQMWRIIAYLALTKADEADKRSRGGKSTPGPRWN